MREIPDGGHWIMGVISGRRVAPKPGKSGYRGTRDRSSLETLEMQGNGGLTGTPSFLGSPSGMSEMEGSF